MSSILKIPNFMDKTMSKNGWSNLGRLLPRNLPSLLPSNLASLLPRNPPSYLPRQIGIFQALFSTNSKALNYNIHQII